MSSSISACPGRADALFELTDALLCTEGPIKTLVGLSLAPEHRRGHGTMYDALNHGRIDVASLRRQLAGLLLPRAADGRLVLAVDVSPWLRKASATGMRSWLTDNDRMVCFGDSAANTALMTATGGWPILLDQAASADLRSRHRPARDR